MYLTKILPLKKYWEKIPYNSRQKIPQSPLRLWHFFENNNI